MPGQPTWFPRIPEMLARLKKPDSPPFYDREAIGALFGLRRRQSIDLMKQLRRYAIGKAWVVDRAEILRFLSQRRRKGQQECERQQKVVDALADLRQEARPGIPIPIRGVTRETFGATLAGLPSGTELIPGRLTISFADCNELLLRLFELAQAIQNDPATFAALSPRPSDKEEDFYV